MSSRYLVFSSPFPPTLSTTMHTLTFYTNFPTNLPIASLTYSVRDQFHVWNFFLFVCGIGHLVENLLYNRVQRTILEFAYSIHAPSLPTPVAKCIFNTRRDPRKERKNTADRTKTEEKKEERIGQVHVFVDSWKLPLRARGFTWSSSPCFVLRYTYVCVCMWWWCRSWNRRTGRYYTVRASEREREDPTDDGLAWRTLPSSSWMFFYFFQIFASISSIEDYAFSRLDCIMYANGKLMKV